MQQAFEAEENYILNLPSVSIAFYIQIFGLLPLDQITMFLTSIMHSDNNSVEKSITQRASLIS